MAEVDNSRYGDLCRLCATKTDLILAINIFENEGAIRQVSKKIETCLQIQVHEADELPKMICENCLYKLDLFCDFLDRTKRTERLLIDLFKEITTSGRLHVGQQQSQPISVVTMDQNDLIMVQHHPLLNETNLHNVSELDLSTHLGGHRENIIVEHEIILTHHSLDGIDLNNHELTSQELSNHSLQTQESILVETSNSHHSIDAPRYTEDNLSLMQQEHLLTDQFRLQHELQQVNIGEDNVNDIHLTENIKDNTYHSDTQNYHSVTKLADSIEKHSIKFDQKLASHLSDAYSDTSSSNHCKLEHDDSNSSSTLLVNNGLNNMDITNNPVYVIQTENDVQDITLPLTDNKDISYCNLCDSTFENKMDFNDHCEKHFNKCSLCLTVFSNDESFSEHKKSCEQKAQSVDLKSIATAVPPKSPNIDQINSLNLEKTKLANVDQDSNSDDSEPEIDIVQGGENEEEVDDPLISAATKRKKWSPKVCIECGKHYKTNYKLTEHMRKHTGEKPYKCKSCDKSFRSKIGLAQHEAKHTGQYDYSCQTCGKGFQCKSYLMVHQRVHSDVKPYPCTTCGQNFKTKQSLLDHTNRHLGVKPYMCEICGRGFITKGLCKAHQKVHSGLDNRKYSCKICSKMFVSKSYLQTHLRIHTGEKPFMCEVCGKGFLTRVDLRIHSTMHTGEKSYVCEMCGKAFARRDALRCHRRSHTGERPYSCDLCGQTFTQFTPMAIHKRLHTGERPYACETCGKTFVSRSTMMAHAKKHTPVKYV